MNIKLIQQIYFHSKVYFTVSSIMNELTCNHEFDFSLQLMSNPPKVRCKRCQITEFLDKAQEFTNSDSQSKVLECREPGKSSEASVPFKTGFGVPS